MSPVPLPSAEAFAAAVERVRGFRDCVIVVKLGGSAMEDPAATDACLRSVAILSRLGVALVLVHGGGKPIDRAMAEAGLTPKKVAGRRYTDEATLKIVVRVLQADQPRPSPGGCKNWESMQTASDIPDADPIICSWASGWRSPGSGREPIDLGRVGNVTRVDADRLMDECPTDR